MSEQIRTLADLKLSGYMPMLARDCLAAIVRKKLVDGLTLFPDIFGLETETRRFLEVLVSGRGVLLTGEYGVAKTDLAKHVFILLNEWFLHDRMYVVDRCPVQEDPGNLIRYIEGLQSAGGAGYAGPCPICRHMIREHNNDPAKIAVRQLDGIREGVGFARVQGGGDVLPEEIVGTYNLLKLAQIGDPFDPRVFEPGKIGQASRGILFVDEIGKLPETAQHALIQASQESIVTPAKSRETFPVDFILVATTNPVDEEYICGAVRDRLVSIKIPLVSQEDEIRIVLKELERIKPSVYVPRIFVKLAVEVTRSLRADERLEMGPRSSINAGLIARSSALLEGRSTATYCNVKEGIYTSILGKAHCEDKDDIQNKIDERFPSIAAYLDSETGHGVLDAAVSRYHAHFGSDAEWDQRSVQKLVTADGDSTCLQQLAGWLSRHETIQHYRLYEVMAVYMSAFDKGCDTDGYRKSS